MRKSRLGKWAVHFNKLFVDPSHLSDIQDLDLIVSGLKLNVGGTVVASEEDKQSFIKNASLFFPL